MNPAISQDEEEIRHLILDCYHRGHELSEGELYRNALHDRWQLFWCDAEGKLGTTDKETYISWYRPEKRDGSLRWETEILHLDISRNLASAKLRIKNQQFGYEDYFLLMRIEGRWWIVHKISQRL